MAPNGRRASKRAYLDGVAHKQHGTARKNSAERPHKKSRAPDKIYEYKALTRVERRGRRIKHTHRLTHTHTNICIHYFAYLWASAHRTARQPWNSTMRVGTPICCRPSSHRARVRLLFLLEERPPSWVCVCVIMCYVTLYLEYDTHRRIHTKKQLTHKKTHAQHKHF